ncbi:ABC transporter ATP-binding protein [Marivirga sp. S37H4]|uniref:ABC transporter ATP-binding protein n=1 Tax=Marivirga aurantiaca TaxID=2802615 RepID=A0A934WXK1_9BACT|nr:ABC transporter ATP-binding protein [Marivirga aurantiaca]MBK6264993.1 ABC transporter ATP-binding protein [Marivirga aurantiaca]
MVKTDNIFHTEKLAIGYKKGRATNILMDNINLSVKRGQMICLLGANGVGKSTLIRTLARLQPTLEGNVILLGKNILDYKHKELAQNISLVLTDPIQGGNLNVLELVQMGRYPHTSWSGQLSSIDDEKVNIAIQQCEIDYIRNSNIFEISDGQLQKALIARALAQDGDLMLLDEPTVHLDANNRFTIMELLKKLVEETGKSVIISTHQVEMALELADELWLASCGDPIVSGKPKELIEKKLIAKMFPYLSKLS